MADFKQRFGQLGQAISESMFMCSLDVVAMVCQYVLHPLATPNAKPTTAMTIGGFTHNCISIACTTDGRIWASDERGVRVFDGSTGEFLFDAAVSMLKRRAAGMVVDADRVFMTDEWGHRIVVAHLDGSTDCAFGTAGDASGSFNSPFGIAADGNGLLFVADEGQHRMQVVTREGKFVRTWGKMGSEHGNFNYLKGLAFSSSRQELYVSDCCNHRCQVFSPEGKFLRVIGKEGREKGCLRFPMGIALDQAGNVLVCDQSNHRVQIFTAEGAHVTMFANHDSAVKAICVDECGRILVGGNNKTIDVFVFQ